MEDEETTFDLLVIALFAVGPLIVFPIYIWKWAWLGTAAVLAAVLFTIWGIIDAAAIGETAWRTADQNKVAWILVQVFLGAIGTIIYLVAIRPKLSRPKRHHFTKEPGPT